MAKEIQFPAPTGATCYVLLFNSAGQVWRTTTAAYVAYNAANYADYAVTAAEFGASGIFSADVPAGAALAADGVIAKRRAGGSAAESDPVVAAGPAPGVEAAGRPSGAAGIARRAWEWEHNLRTRDRTTGAVTLYAADGVTVLETQTQSTAADTDTQTKGV